MFETRQYPLAANLIALVFISFSIPINCYYNETLFKQIVLHDHTNDDAIKMSSEQLIVRSGFRYKDYFSVADDGYITQVIHLINPRADPKHLKQPPVLLLHGSHLDTSHYLVSSSIQHFPEPWPRKASDGPMRSSNRSLGFTLANNGFDVWLVGSRGSNYANSGWTSETERCQSEVPNFRPTKMMLAMAWHPKYWDYCLDDVIKNELHRQIDLVRNLTGSKEYHYFSFSLSTTTTMAFLAENPDYAKQVRTFTQMAPVVAASHFSHFSRLYWQKLVPLLSGSGIGFTPSFFLDNVFMKNLVLYAANFDHLRYSFVYELYRELFGPSPIYQTNLERNFVHHAFQPVAFKSAKHYGQSSRAQKLRYYDYGWLMNLFHYNSTTPPEHKVDRLEVQNYLVVSASLDCLADGLTVQRLIELTSTPKPATHIIAPGFNHIDLIAAVEVDFYVNLPLVEYLNRHSDLPGASSKLFAKNVSATAQQIASNH